MPHLHKFAVLVMVAAVTVGLVVPRAREHRPVAQAQRQALTRQIDKAREPVRRPAAPRIDTAKAAAAARAVRANELGLVPVLMIHRVVAKPATTLDRTPTQIYDELTRLARENYVPVTAAEYVTGRINVPAGRHPVVLTFDDGSDSQVAFDPYGNPKPDTAVGLLQRVAREHPGWRPVATFFVNQDPFQLGDRAAWAMRWLVQHGFEVANHTTTHGDLSSMSKSRVHKEIGTDQKMIADADGTPPITFAFPYGSPADLSWAEHGTYGGVSWAFKGMFLAGWDPAKSPFNQDYDFRQIPRIRSAGKIKEDDCRQFCSAAWLDWLDKHPDKLYTSDGNPATVAFPQPYTAEVASYYRSRAIPY